QRRRDPAPRSARCAPRVRRGRGAPGRSEAGMPERAVPRGGSPMILGPLLRLLPPLPSAARRLRFAIPIAILLAAGSGCSHSGGEESEGEKPVVPVVVRHLVRGTLRETVKVSGQWRVADSVTVFAPFRAYVETLRPHAGDPVTRGQTIGLLVTY